MTHPEVDVRGTMPTRTLLVVVLAVALATAACGTDGTAEATRLTGGTWELVEGQTVDGPLTPPADSRITFLVEEDGTFGGTAACNGYVGTLIVDGDRIDLGDFSITTMGCEPHLTEAEQRFVGALGVVETAARDEDGLTLSGPDVQLQFALQPPVKDQALADTTWVLDTLISGSGPDSAASSVMGEPELVFDDQGGIVAETGCRTFRGRYTLNGDEVSLPEFGTDSTDETCEGSLQAQEAHVIAVLEGGFRVGIEGPRLTLTATNGQALSFQAAD